MRQDDMLKLFWFIFHKIYESLINNKVSNIEISKEPIKPENFPLLVVTSDMSTYQHMCNDYIHTFCKSLVEIKHFRYEWPSIIYENTQKHNKIKEHSITCSYIWHINISKCVYWLDTHSAKVWCYYFCDIILRHRAMFSTCPYKEPQKSKIGQQ